MAEMQRSDETDGSRTAKTPRSAGRLGRQEPRKERGINPGVGEAQKEGQDDRDPKREKEKVYGETGMETQKTTPR